MRRYIDFVKWHKWKFSALLVVTISAIVFTMKWHAKPNAALPDVWVKTTKVEVKKMPLEVTTIGSLAAKRVAITPEISGHIKTIFFHDGDTVKAGDPLYQMEDAMYQAKYASTLAKYRYSKINYDRLVLLGKRGAVATQAVDEAKANLEEMKAAVDESKVVLNQMVLKAPFDGVVSKSLVTRGEYVNSGQALVTLTDNTHLRLEYALPEEYLPSIQLGQTVVLKTAAYPNVEFNGQVAFIAPDISVDNRAVSLYAKVDNTDHRLSPGMFVDIAQSLGTEKDIVMVPERSLIPILDGQQVYKLMNGKVYATKVKIGKRQGDQVQVIDGLSKNDEIVTDGQMKLKNGITVKVTAT